MEFKYPRRDMPLKVTDEFIDELYLGKKNNNFELRVDYSVNF